MSAKTNRLKKDDTSVRAYFFREAIEVCVVLVGLAIADCFANVPRWLWIVLPSAKLLISVLFYLVFVKKVLRQRPRHGVWSMAGRTARTLVALDPDGQVKVNGEIWPATTCDGSTILSDQNVIIRDVRVRTLVVERQDKTEA